MADLTPGAIALCASAERLAGLACSVDIAKYCAFIYPHDNPCWAVAAAPTQSSCMMAVMRNLENNGAVGEGFADPYEKHSGQVGIMLVRAAKAWGAWWECSSMAGIKAYLANDAPQPTAGQMFWIGLEGANGKELPGWGGISHMFTTVDMSEADLDGGTKFNLLTTIEGGSPDPKGYSIQRRHRQMVMINGEIWMREVLQNTNGSWRVKNAGRRVYGVIDPSRGKLAELLAAAVSSGDA
jgi:hypothetical protein